MSESFEKLKRLNSEDSEKESFEDDRLQSETSDEEVILKLIKLNGILCFS